MSGHGRVDADGEIMPSSFGLPIARAPPGLGPMFSLRSRLRTREISMRKLVGDTQTMLEAGPGEGFEGRD